MICKKIVKWKGGGINREAEHSKILREKTGVTRISEYDLLPID